MTAADERVILDFGPKIRQILLEDPSVRPRAEAGGLAAGTVESFLIWRLTGGRTHITNVANASRSVPPRHPHRRLGPPTCST